MDPGEPRMGAVCPCCAELSCVEVFYPWCSLLGWLTA